MLSLSRESIEVSIDVIKTLLSEENLKFTSFNNATLLHAACSSGNLHAAKYFVENGLRFDALTNQKETLLHYAVDSGNIELITWLIKSNKIDIDARDSFGQAALYRAAMAEKLEVVKLLIQHGANPTMIDYTSKEAFNVAFLTSLDLNSPEDKLLEKINVMGCYGLSLSDQDFYKGRTALTLSNELRKMATDFLKLEANARDFNAFQSNFLNLLHSEDNEMGSYRISWGTIIANISIALTGIGLLFTAAQLTYSKVTEGRALFFFQKSKTTREETVAELEEALEAIGPGV